MGVKLFGYHAGNNGVSHYRIWQPLKYLGRIEGFHVERLPDRLERIQWEGLTGPCNVPGIGSHAEIVDNHDVIMSNFRGSFEDGVRLEIQAQLKPLIIDCDDDILNIDASNPAEHLKAWREEKPDVWLEIPEGMEESAEWKKNANNVGGKILQNPKDNKWYLWQCRRAPWKNAIEQMKMAALVTVSTPKLKRLYQKFNGNTVVIPNGVDFELWPAKNVIDDGIIRIGLFGSNTHYQDWFEIVDTLDLILRENPNVRLCFNNWWRGKSKQGQSLDEFDKKPQFPDFFEKKGFLDHPQVEIIQPCEIQDYPKWLAETSIDIGLAPLKKSAFNEGKSNIKYLEFSALKIPGVYADIITYNDDVQHGHNGFLAGNPDEWYSCITRLIKDADLRRVMANRAHLDVKARYDQAKISAKLGAEILKIVDRSEHEARMSRLNLVAAR